MDRSIHTSWWDPWWPAETCWIFDKETHSLICTLSVFLIAQFHTSNTFSSAQEQWFFNYYFHINTLLIRSHSGMSVCRFAVIPCGYCSQKSFKVWYILWLWMWKISIQITYAKSRSYSSLLVVCTMSLCWKIWILTNCSSVSWSHTPCSVRGNSSVTIIFTYEQRQISIHTLPFNPLGWNLV
jgi:hypothetical protein